MPKCKFILKNSSLKVLDVFPPICVVDTKIIYSYNFVAPLILSIPYHINTYFWSRF